MYITHSYHRSRPLPSQGYPPPSIWVLSPPARHLLYSNWAPTHMGPLSHTGTFLTSPGRWHPTLNHLHTRRPLTQLGLRFPTPSHPPFPDALPILLWLWPPMPGTLLRGCHPYLPQLCYPALSCVSVEMLRFWHLMPGCPYMDVFSPFQSTDIPPSAASLSGH